MLPCIALDFFLNNQQEALIIQIYDSAWKGSSETCMKVTIAECTAENS